MFNRNQRSELDLLSPKQSSFSSFEFRRGDKVWLLDFSPNPSKPSWRGEVQETASSDIYMVKADGIETSSRPGTSRAYPGNFFGTPTQLRHFLHLPLNFEDPVESPSLLDVWMFEGERC
ncbi:hypothetical protein Ciccas_011397 [Cichlidogyrus casuarinus]|uniref:Uncharacterized protein n=1 Tax=Cichlidogyrus casuarinus TaxID=1844966 RepID=A0ABD2PRC2_9PLAT